MSIQIVPAACLTYDSTHCFNIPSETATQMANTKYCTHTSIHAERLHAVSQALFLPGRLFLQYVAKLIEPAAGQYKTHTLWNLAERITSFTLALFISPFALILSPIALGLRAIEHTYRPAISVYTNEDTIGRTQEELQLSMDNPLHVRSHNLGFVPTFMSTVGDLRHPILRAREVVHSVLSDPRQPDVIFFQETFHEDASAILCRGISKAYPTIIHSIAPQIGGFSSGTMIASKYPIKEIKFERFGNMMGVENLAPRGITRVVLEKPDGDVFLYSVHTVALLGEERALARVEQIKQVQAFMEQDARENMGIHQLLVGDFNTSQVSAWGENNEDQSEKKVLDQFNGNFNDLFTADHDPLTGQRKEGSQSEFLEIDNKRLGKEDLVEPSGSWYHGPFANKGATMNAKEAIDRKTHGYPDPQKVQGIDLEESTWGTKEWTHKQPAKTARFDYIVTPKFNDTLTGKVEIRRVITPKYAQSASTDHLPVDGLIWIKPQTIELSEDLS